MREVAEEKEEESGDTPAGRLTHSLLMQTAPLRASTSRKRQDSREYRCVWTLMKNAVMSKSLISIAVYDIEIFFISVMNYFYGHF